MLDFGGCFSFSLYPLNGYNENYTWANIARTLQEDSDPVIRFIKSIFYKPFLEDPDDYIAIGTGLIKTKNDYSHLYDHTSDRDICWVSKENDAKELLTIDGIYSSKTKNAGIQLKVSCANNGYYVTNYFKKKPYHQLYPVVYFDLGNDFNKVRDNLMNMRKYDEKVSPNSLFSHNVSFDGWSRDEILDIMLIRGCYIDHRLHDQLLYYKDILEQVISGKIDLYDLGNKKIVMSLVLEYVGRNIKNSNSMLTIAN
ncbi:MAG: hypothetical protein PT120_25480 [Aphanizomenon gracile PMC649.10]|nr:hypothetical protein [Aphanizomenon gracile PMC649.10]